MGTFVSVGNHNTPFERIWRLVRSARHMLPTPIVAQIGYSDPYGISSFCDVRCSLFSREDFDRHVKEAELIVGHCGVGLLLKANSHARVPLLVPRRAALREHTDDHQMELAEVVARLALGRIVDIPESIDEFGRAAGECRTTPSPGQITIGRPSLDGEEPLLLAASVGGHMDEGLRLVANEARERRLVVITDKHCVETTEGRFLLFPSCNNRVNFPVRVVQAIRLLKTLPRGQLVTTGAGVGAVFVAAAMTLGYLRPIAIESLTRIKGPSLWFRVAMRLGADCHAPSWAEWLSLVRYSCVRPFDVSIAAPLSG